MPRPSLLARFGVLSALPILLLGYLLVQDIRTSMRAETLHDARVVAELTAHLKVQPFLREADLERPVVERRIRALDAMLEAGLADQRVIRIKLWNRNGRVTYSDDRSIIGRTFRPGPQLREAFGGVTASKVIKTDSAEQGNDRAHRELVEVYVPVRFGGDERPAGAFEIYIPWNTVAERIERESRETIALLLAGLALLWLLLFRLVATASRRLRTQADENRRLALEDPLTGLPNRAHFIDRVTAVLARRDHGPTVVMYVDVDRFKAINDAVGHAGGDRVLRAVADRLRAIVRPSDVVSRLSGDEFAVMCDGLGTHEEGLEIARRLSTALDMPIGDVGVAVTASIGLAYAGPDDDAEALLRAADAAMYDAKRAGTRMALAPAA